MFAYVNGLLLLLCGSWFKYQLATNFIITFLSAISMFALLKQNKIRMSISIFLSITYTTLNAVQGWTFNQTLKSWACVLLPLGLLVGIKFWGSDNKWQNCFLLAFVVTLSIQIHVLTSVFLVFLLMIFFVIGMFVTKNRFQLIEWVSTAAVLTIAMTANVWYPLLETNLENIILPPRLNYDFNATSLRVVLSDFPTHISLLVSSLFILQAFFTLFIKNNLLNRTVTILGFTLFFASTKIFPWNEIIEKFPAITIIQFPTRFLEPAVILIIFGLGLSLELLLKEKNYKIKKISIYMLLIFLTICGGIYHFKSANNRLALWQSDDVFFRDRTTIALKDDAELLRNSFKEGTNLDEPFKLLVKPTSDYVPLKDKKFVTSPDFHSFKEYKEAIIDNPLNSKLKKSVEKNKLVYRWQANSQATQVVPVIVYHRTVLQLNGTLLDKKDINTNNIGALVLTPKKGENVLKISYDSSFIFKYMLLVSMVSWILFSILVFGYSISSK
jgi:hypothetical protein